MSKWEEKRLGDICDHITDGKHGDCENSENSGYYFISSKDVYDGKIHYKNARQITKNDFIEANKRTKLQCGDILITNSGSIGRMALIGLNDKFNNTTFQKSVAIIKPNKNNINEKYLYYELINRNDKLTNLSGGTAQHNLLLKDIRMFKVMCPPLPIQQKIAGILSAYDDLIENNNRRIELLEKAAQDLYKEWFVRFRFPNYKQTKFENGLPKGWEYVKLKDYFKTTSGGTPSRKNENFYINGKYDWIKTGELKDRFIITTDEKITEEAIKNSSAKLIEKGSLIMAMYGATIGKLGFTIEESTCNQACCVFNTNNNELTNEYLYFWLLTNREYIINISFGAAQQNLSQDLINNLNILKPDKYVVELFDKIIKLNFEEIKILQIENQNLIKQRDLLLPRLMSGKLEVE